MSAFESATIQQQRQQFPYLDRYTYFNYGGQGSMPARALEAMYQAQLKMQEISPFSYAANDWMNQATAALRSLMADELGAHTDSISIVENTTIGCNIAMWGLDWHQDDRILITDCEHQGIIGTAQELQHRFAIDIDICPMLETVNGGDPVSVIRDAIQPNTRMLVISHILWNTGQVLPLPEIIELCRAHNILVMVDAAQSVGVLPLNLTELGADFYAFTGHKWWCGPAGIGGLYVRPEVRERLRPTFIGWRSVITNAQGQPTRFQPNSERYEVATSAVPLYAGLEAALNIHRSFGSGVERYKLICAQATNLWEQLKRLEPITCVRPTTPDSGLVAFQLASGQHKQLVQRLEHQGIYVRLLLNPNCVRACTHYLTTDAEIQHLVEAIDQLTQ
ncbi:aminotransferase class V-fold PLP-dependent enzyme [filamentous cyanobacterium LEGE 11480]|uniref:Aminotransferase class V-fold PLP-dependent enzyme n=1 Tax=Romeriopsis navalis LEGE 11480 TaxID=2777977 RepID=A0A928VMH9_9CYAN|nr:aminotransferase class V-fold PLP-dependent enzyme [Romeriopsis navalis]MBE9031333.1 aminotransferase class V-fold PLP-dependent enzyme [Romeriopsis navalis LEGE 11480]